MPSIGPLEAVIVLAVILIVFGVGRLPEVGGAMGKAIHEFRKASTATDEEAKKTEDAKKA